MTSGSTTNDSTIALTFTAKRATSNFVVGDITVSERLIEQFAAVTSTVYTLPLRRPGQCSDCDVTAANLPMQLAITILQQSVSWTYDNTSPTVTITGPTGVALKLTSL